MFGKRALQVQLVKKNNSNKTTDTDVEQLHVDAEKIAQIIKDNAKPALITIGIIVAANKILNTACEIAIIAAKAKL